MCLLCAHTVFVFLHDTEKGPRSLCFKPFVKTTSTRGETLISSQNDTKFARTKWGRLEFEIDQISGACFVLIRFPGGTDHPILRDLDIFVT